MPVTVTNTRSTLATDPLRNFRFVVRIAPEPHIRKDVPFAQMGFMSLAGLNITTEPIAYRQGGYNTTTQKMPGQSDFSPVTLQRGVILGTNAMWYWFKEIFFFQGGGVSNLPQGADFRRTLEVAVLEHPRPTAQVNVKMRFTIFNAWPVSLSYSDLDAGGNQVLVEQVTLVHEGWDINWATSTRAEAGRSAFV